VLHEAFQTRHILNSKKIRIPFFFCPGESSGMTKRVIPFWDVFNLLVAGVPHEAYSKFKKDTNLIYFFPSPVALKYPFRNLFNLLVAGVLHEDIWNENLFTNPYFSFVFLTSPLELPVSQCVQSASGGSVCGQRHCHQNFRICLMEHSLFWTYDQGIFKL